MTGDRSFSRRLAGFVGLPLLSLLAPFLLLPIIARIGGVEGWAAIAIGQSIGSFTAIVVTYGWTLVGPARIAAANVEGQLALYGDSVISRILLLLAIGPLSVAATYMLSPASFRTDAAIMTIAIAAGSLSPTWYSIGLGRPRLIAAYEVVPRLAGIAIAAMLLIRTEELVAYPICLIISSLAGSIAYSVRIGEIHKRLGLQLPRVMRQMWADRSAALAVIAAGSYSATPVAILSIVAPVSSVAMFSSADKLFKMSLLSVQAVGNAFQGWVAEDQPLGISGRMRKSFWAHLSLGLLGFGGLALLGAPLTSALFGAAVAADQITSVFFGVAFLAVSVNTSTGRHMLIPLGRTDIVLRSTLAGAVTGIIAMASLGALHGGSGAAGGLAIGEVVVCLVQFAALCRLRHHRN